MSRLRVGSLFAGIGGFDLGFHRAGFDVAWAAEWDKHAQNVLRRRFPGTIVYGDIREIDLDKLEPVDVICGGFPCQDLSVAGKRAGLAGERSGLFHDAMRIVRRLRPSVLILENVPGLLSSNRGLDFATVLREVGEGWDCAEVAWRVLDSQFFGVAQRRRRVFIVAVRDPAIGCAEEILALASSGGGHPPAKREAREGSASDAARSADVGRWWDGGDCAATLTKQNANGSQRMPDKGNFGAVVQPFTRSSHAQYREGVGTLQANGGDIGGGSESLIAFRKSKRAQSATDDETWVDDGLANTLNGFDTGDARTTHAVAFGVDVYNGIETGDVAATMTTQSGTASGSGPKVAHAFYSTGGSHGLQATPELSPPLKVGSALGIPSPPAVAFSCKDHGADASAVAPTLRAMPHSGSHANGGGQVAVATAMVVRRLTPVECERLQGFPDGWTDIGTPEKPTADSHRYKQLGNAVTVNVAEWLAHRVAAVLSGQQ